MMNFIPTEYDMANVKSILSLILILVVFLSLGIIGRADMENAEKEFFVYCTDIENGIYPDFKNLSEKCKEFSHK